MNERPLDPLFGAPPERVQLQRAPLERVLAQVQFPPVLKINEQGHIADFQEALRKDYPFLQKDVGQSMTVQVNAGNVSVNPTEETIWRFFDQEKNWRVSLALRSVSIEVRRYSSRFDFLDRLQTVLTAVNETISPGPATRVGFRYVNRLSGAQELQQLVQYVQPELIGLLGEPMATRVDHSLSEATCSTEEGRLLARWGKMQPFMTHDPDMAAPIDQHSWVLDIDSFLAMGEGGQLLVEGGFNPVALNALTEKLANRAYAFFRWSVKPAFLERFGVEQ